MNPLDHPQWRGFVARMREAPADLETRLVAADWLTEQGRDDLTAWSDFVRHQVAATAARAGAAYAHPAADWCDCPPCRSDRAAAVLWERWGAAWCHLTAPEPNAAAAVLADPTLWRDGLPVALRVQPGSLARRPAATATPETARIVADIVECVVLELASRVPIDAVAVTVFAESYWCAAACRPDPNPLLVSYHLGTSFSPVARRLAPAMVGGTSAPCRPDLLAGTARVAAEILYTDARLRPDTGLVRRGRPVTPATVLGWLTNANVAVSEASP